MTYKTIGDLVDAIAKRAAEPETICAECGVGYWRTRSYGDVCEACRAPEATTCDADQIEGVAPVFMEYTVDCVSTEEWGDAPASENASRATAQKTCSPRDIATSLVNAVMIDHGKYLVDRMVARDRAMARGCADSTAMLADIPHRRAIHCRHCDRHHEAELKQPSAQDGALYECECPGTGRAVRQWVSAEEMWG